MASSGFDVIVLGARTRGAQALAELAAAIARITGLAPGAVQRGLEVGEVVIRHGIPKPEALAASREVQELGGIVEVRPARAEAAPVAIEPDDELTLERPLLDEPPPRASEPAPPEPPRPAAADRTVLDPNAPVLDLGDRPMAARFTAPAPVERRIELDFAAAGLTAAPAGTTALRGASASSSSGAAASSGALSMPDASASLPAMHSGIDDLGEPPPRGLLDEDRLTSALFGAAIAAVLGMFVAFAIVRREASSIAERLEPELAAAVADPLGVEAERVRAPAEIVADIDRELAGVRSSYFAIWAAITLPLGVAAALIKRPIR